MSLEFKELLGNRVYLEIPKKEETKLIVDENTKEALQKKMLKDMSKLKVYAVGDLVTKFKAGDLVLPDPSKLRDAHVIPLSDKREVLLISSFDIIHVW